MGLQLLRATLALWRIFFQDARALHIMTPLRATLAFWRMALQNGKGSLYNDPTPSNTGSLKDIIFKMHGLSVQWSHSEQHWLSEGWLSKMHGLSEHDPTLTPCNTSTLKECPPKCKMHGLSEWSSHPEQTLVLSRIALQDACTLWSTIPLWTTPAPWRVAFQEALALCSMIRLWATLALSRTILQDTWTL